MKDCGICKEMPYFGEFGLSCAESTLRYLIEKKVVDLPLSAVKMMTGLHGNMGRCANCGAVNGAVAAIGSKLGRTEPDYEDEVLYETVEKFMQAFEQKFGTVKCADLIAGEDPAAEHVQKRCAECVLFAAGVVEQLLAETEPALTLRPDAVI